MDCLLNRITQKRPRIFDTGFINEVEHKGITVQTHSIEIAKQVFDRLNTTQLKRGFGYCNIDGNRIHWELISRRKKQ